jgi:hypothetical protein
VSALPCPDMPIPSCRTEEPRGTRDRYGTGTPDTHELANETIREPTRQGSKAWVQETEEFLLRHTTGDPWSQVDDRRQTTANAETSTRRSAAV